MKCAGCEASLVVDDRCDPREQNSQLDKHMPARGVGIRAEQLAYHQT